MQSCKQIDLLMCFGLEKASGSPPLDSKLHQRPEICFLQTRFSSLIPHLEKDSSCPFREWSQVKE
ncbi:Hypothetical predicted protein [Podarcis lilfordi]|uniref:Uncharacterized protein n=1 Tax=Podarcis lilfordi TaxID=74358 RepID=A0AA35NZF1_9SAUR|nr:Hypothetical predicted protein [Podarcis lilfordi]